MSSMTLISGEVMSSWLCAISSVGVDMSIPADDMSDELCISTVVAMSSGEVCISSSTAGFVISFADAVISSAMVASASEDAISLAGEVSDGSEEHAVMVVRMKSRIVKKVRRRCMEELLERLV